MDIKEYISHKKEIHNLLLMFIENPDQDLEILKEFFQTHEYLKNKEELRHFLQLILNISNNYHRDINFTQKIKIFFLLVEDMIKSTFNNQEIFNIFKYNKLVLLILIENNILKIDEIIVQIILETFYPKDKQYFYYFYPEIKSIINKETNKKIEEELLKLDSNIFNNFETKRQIGENDSYICSLIREDSVEEFVSYINRSRIKLSSQIAYSIFETNSFLIENKSTLIEYAAFFGSIQIFQYLRFNQIELTSSLWLYVIHSKNAELIHILEENDVEPPKGKYEECLLEAIKCHHNDIANYIKLNLIEQITDKSEKMAFIEIVFECSFRYSNYTYFPNDINLHFLFFYLCKYNYTTLVNLYLQTKKDNIESIISKKI